MKSRLRLLFGLIVVLPVMAVLAPATSLAIPPPDVEAPTLTFSAPTEGALFNTASPVTSFSGVDSPFGGGPSDPVFFECTQGLLIINQTCTSGSTVPGSPLADGSYTLGVRAVDSAPLFNTSATQYHSFTIDTTAPVITITSPTNGSKTGEYTPDIAFSIVGADTAQCRFDGGEFSACSNNFVGPELAAGSHEFSVRATDLAYNTAVVHVTFTIDPTLPLENPDPPLAASIASAKRKLSKGKLSVPVTISILPPVNTSPLQACRGNVKVSVKPKGSRSYRKTLKLKRSDRRCIAKGFVLVPRSLKGRKATLRAAVAGNDWMEATVVTSQIKKL
ncbi:MAG: hypothetical protein JHC87_02320 [Thermoleophilaceae bacterium]|nr:hypothetical protein [Thermoleophilaceae bacterium]